MTQATAQQTAPSTINGIDVAALGDIVEMVKADPSKGIVAFKVNSAWQGQTRSEATVESFSIGGDEVPRRFTIAVDEPHELLGENTAPNPQEMLMTALNSCIMVGYVAGASVHGITLESVEIETHGSLDLRGFLGIDESVPPGYESIQYTVRIKGDGTQEQFQEIHETVIKTSPNYFNVSRPITIDATLEVQT